MHVVSVGWVQFDPFAPLYAELKFASNKKTFKKYFFEFNRTTLAYRRESKASYKSYYTPCLSVCLSGRAPAVISPTGGSPRQATSLTTLPVCLSVWQITCCDVDKH